MKLYHLAWYETNNNVHVLRSQIFTSEETRDLKVAQLKTRKNFVSLCKSWEDQCEDVFSLHPSMITREFVLDMAMHDPILHNSLQLWHKGELTFEEAVSYAAVVLSVELKNMRELAIEAKKLEMPTEIKPT